MKHFIEKYGDYIKSIILLVCVFYACSLILAANYDNIIPNNKRIEVITLAIPGCSGCHKMQPVVEEVAKSKRIKDEGITVSFVESRDVLEKYSVESVPTTLVLVNGREQRRHVGYLDKEGLLAFIFNKN